MEELGCRVIRFALRGLADAEAARRADRHRDRPRRRDDQRHLHPHRHGRAGVQRACSWSRTRGPTPSSRASGLDISIDGEKPPPPPVDASLLEDVRGVDEVALATGSILDEETTKVVTPDGECDRQLEGWPTLGFGHGSRAPALAQLQPAHISSRARWPAPPTRSSSTRGPRTSRGTRSATPSRSRPCSRSEPFTLVGVARYGEVESLGAISFAVFTIPTRRRFWAARGSTTRSPSQRARDLGGRARRGDRARASGGCGGRERDRGGRGAGRRGQPVHVDLPILPPRLRERSRSSSARSSSSTRSRSPSRSARASSRRCGRSAPHAARCSAR